jgi:uncharacterized membrane protein YbhN (UPF0104 family)
MRINWRSTLQTLFAILLMVLGVLFFVKNRGELRDVVQAFGQAQPGYLLIALIAAVLTVLAQAYAISLSYRAIEKEVPLRETIPLYLKRYFLSPFIPGGFSVAQYTLTKDLEHHEITTAEHAFVSSGYVLAGITSYLIVLIPVVFLISRTFFTEQSLIYTVAKVIAVLVLIGAVLGILFRPYLSRLIRGWLMPHIGHFHSIPLIKATCTSLIVDTAGIVMLWSAIHALGINLSAAVASAAYILTVLVLTISPLFQGLVVVEGILTYFLGQAGVPAGEALAGVLIFRGFQMWLPILVGGIVYVWPYWHKAREKFGIEG